MPGSNPTSNKPLEYMLAGGVTASISFVFTVTVSGVSVVIGPWCGSAAVLVELEYQRYPYTPMRTKTKTPSMIKKRFPIGYIII
jgi:hypothetical protein